MPTFSTWATVLLAVPAWLALNDFCGTQQLHAQEPLSVSRVTVLPNGAEIVLEFRPTSETDSCEFEIAKTSNANLVMETLHVSPLPVGIDMVAAQGGNRTVKITFAEALREAKLSYVDSGVTATSRYDVQGGTDAACVSDEASDEPDQVVTMTHVVSVTNGTTFPWNSKKYVLRLGRPPLPHVTLMQPPQAPVDKTIQFEVATESTALSMRHRADLSEFTETARQDTFVGAAALTFPLKEAWPATFRDTGTIRFFWQGTLAGTFTPPSGSAADRAESFSNYVGNESVTLDLINKVAISMAITERTVRPNSAPFGDDPSVFYYDLTEKLKFEYPDRPSNPELPLAPVEVLGQGGDVFVCLDNAHPTAIGERAYGLARLELLVPLPASTPEEFEAKAQAIGRLAEALPDASEDKPRLQSLQQQAQLVAQLLKAIGDDRKYAKERLWNCLASGTNDGGEAQRWRHSLDSTHSFAVLAVAAYNSAVKSGRKISFLNGICPDSTTTDSPR